VLATERAGSDGFLFWNPNMRNEVAMTAMRSIDKQQKNGTSLLGAQKRPEKIKAGWCPEKGNVFATAVEREKKGRRGAEPAHKAAATSARCTGACTNP
jgi:hypothetical protein